MSKYDINFTYTAHGSIEAEGKNLEEACSNANAILNDLQSMGGGVF